MTAEGLSIHQPRSGYRFSLDALLLASHVEPKPRERILELGAGCGVVSLTLAHQYSGISLVGVEVQSKLAQFAQQNVVDNGFTHQVSILQHDMRVLKPQHCGGRFDTVISNPPYGLQSAGRINPNPQKAAARHEITITLPELINIAYRLLVSRGRMVMIYTTQRLPELLTRLRESNLKPTWVRFVHSYAEVEAGRVLVGAQKGGHSGFQVHPPLIIYSAPSIYSMEAEAILSRTPGSEYTS